MKKNKPGKKAGTPEEQTRSYHFRQIDILKGLAIISVILVHTFSNEILMAIGAPFHIWQAVPVFLLLAGFTSAYALASYKKKTLAQSYDIPIIIRRLRRILGPFLIIWIVQSLIVLYIILTRSNLPIQIPNHFLYRGFDIVLNFLSGGQGPGSYFVPVILQQIFLIPLFYYLALRSPDRMLVIAFTLDIFLEFCMVIAAIPPWLYSILCIRYIFAGALGVWLVFRKDAVPKWLFACALASLVYIYVTQYLNFQFWFIYPGWSFFHVFSYFWTVVIVFAGLQFLPREATHAIPLILEELGKASWHIFLVQMTFFFACWGTIMQYTDSAIVSPVITLAACLSLGYGFYKLMEYARKKRKIGTGFIGKKC